MPRALPASAHLLLAVVGWLAGCGGIPERTAAPADPLPSAASGGARNVYVLLSGGGTPLSNNYSQYLQAKALAQYLQAEFPVEDTWVFFGLGSRPEAAPVLADVRREEKRDGRILQTWLPGPLPRNRPATRESFLRALREEILPAVSGGGTLYLWVGDHGELAGEEKARESAITLWQLKPSRRRSGGWNTDDEEILRVSELREALAAGLGRGRVVFCMTQCHSGGFHDLAVAREMIPPRDWFAVVPSGLPRPTPGLRLRAAGYTATDQASPAAGCDPDPDPERWLGYERLLPEALLGRDLMSGQPKGPGLRSFAEAHEAATLLDHTIDKPRSTSEHYLEAWARAIETRLSRTLAVTERTRRAVEGFHRTVDRGLAGSADLGLAARAEQFARFRQSLAGQLPADRGMLETGTRAQLEEALRGRGGRGGGPAGGRRASLAAARRAWSEVLRPAWKALVGTVDVPGLTPAARAFERRLLEQEEKGRDFLLPRGSDDTPLLNELYWHSGYAEPARLDRGRATEITGWAADRRDRIVAWGRASPDPRLRAAAEAIGPGPVMTEQPPTPLSRRTAVERVLFQRRVLAAWEFLLAMEAAGPLSELRTLLELERTPVRR